MTTDAPDITELIRTQHAQVRELLDTVARIAPSGRRAAFEPLVRLLAVHETAEEEIVYPSIRTMGDGAGEVVSARKTEEDRAKKALAELEGTDPETDRFAELFTPFHAAVLEHAAAEEAQVIPLLLRADPDRRKAMGDLFRTAEAMAPTHAHRAAPESAIGNALVGPFVAMVDKVRDALRDARRD